MQTAFGAMRAGNDQASGSMENTRAAEARIGEHAGEQMRIASGG